MSDETTPSLDRAALRKMVEWSVEHNKYKWVSVDPSDILTLLSSLDSKDEEIARLTAERDAGREWMRRSWQEFNAIKARNGAPEGVSEDWWSEITSALGEMLGDDSVPWMTQAARLLVRPYEERSGTAEAEVARLTGELAKARALVSKLENDVAAERSAYIRAHNEIANLTFSNNALATENANLREALDAALSALPEGETP